MSLILTDETLQAMSIQAIRGYKNFPYEISDEDILTKYALAITLIKQNITDSLALDKSISEEDQGDRDVTYRENINWIDNGIKLLIGNPYIKFL